MAQANRGRTGPESSSSGDPPAATNALARWSPVVARVLMGLMFVVFGLNKFWNFVPLPQFAEPATAFFQAASMRPATCFR